MAQYDGFISYYGEVDYYSIYLQAGRTYYFEAEGSATSRGTLSDPLLTLYRGSTYINENDDGGVGYNARLIYTPSVSGYYSLQAEGLDAIGSYRLLVNIDDFRGTAEGLGAAGPIGDPRAPIYGEIDYLGDRDVFSTHLIAGLTYSLNQRGAPTGNGSLEESALRLLDEFDNQLAYSDMANGTYNATIVYRAQYTGTYYLQAGAYFDSFTGSYEVNVSAGRATTGNDVVNGTVFADAINGLQGSDNLRGGGGADQLFGAQHGDILRGQAGNDLLAGGLGADILVGGLGADTFVYGGSLDSTPQAVDVIRAGDGAAAFELAGRAGGDRIDLSAIDANILRPGNQAFVFNGTAAGGLSFAESRGDTLVRGNLDNDAAFELVIRIEDGGLSHRAYGAIDFLL